MDSLNDSIIDDINLEDDMLDDSIEDEDILQDKNKTSSSSSFEDDNGNESFNIYMASAKSSFKSVVDQLESKNGELIEVQRERDLYKRLTIRLIELFGDANTEINPYTRQSVNAIITEVKQQPYCAAVLLPGPLPLSNRWKTRAATPTTCSRVDRVHISNSDATARLIGHIQRLLSLSLV